MDAVFGIAQFLVIFLLSPFFAGFIHKIKQRMRRQEGISVFQFYRNIAKLVQKEVVLSRDASFISHTTPYVVAGAYLTVISMIPAFYQKPLLGGASDIILVVYVIVLSTFFLTLYALDAGSSFGGLGSSREWLITVISEPTLIFVLVSLAINSGRGTLEGIFFSMMESGALTVPLSLAIASVSILLLSENARIPFDNPETHLELTMIHEANILEASGRHLAMFEYASYLKLTVFMTLLSLMVFPYVALTPHSMPLACLVYVLKMTVLSALIAFVEMVTPKLKLFRTPNLLSIGFVLSLLSMILTIRGG